MSKLNAGLYSSEDMTWCTPPALVDALLNFEGRVGFDLDAASTQPNIPARLRYTENGLFQGSAKLSNECGLTGSWDTCWEICPGAAQSLVWLNPPYGKKLKLFMEKVYSESQKRNVRIWALVPARTETRYQHDFGLTQAGFTVFLKGRLHFLQNGEDKGSAPFPTMLLYFGDDWQEKARRWVESPPLEGTLMIRGGGE